MALVYATRADLEAYAPAGVTVPADPEASRLLARASERIGVATRSAVYHVDSGGMPTDSAVADAMRDATCALVVHWLTTGSEDDDAAAYTSVSIGSISVQRAPGAAAGTGRVGTLPVSAWTPLELAGLVGGPITHR